MLDWLTVLSKLCLHIVVSSYINMNQSKMQNNSYFNKKIIFKETIGVSQKCMYVYYVPSLIVNTSTWFAYNMLNVFCWYCHCNPQVCRFYWRVTSLDVKWGVCPRAGIWLRRIFFWGWIFWHRWRGRRYHAYDETRVRQHGVGGRVKIETIIFAFQ